MLASLLNLTLGLLLVLALRRPVRRLFGAGPAFTLWLWPLLLAALPWLPAFTTPWETLPPVLVAARRVTMGMAVPDAVRQTMWLVIWLAGAALALLRLGVAYLRLRLACRPVSRSLRESVRALAPTIDPRRLRVHPQGPAVLWAWRSLVLLPPDFTSRGDLLRQRVILAHEQSHLQRRDPLWTLLAELAVALLWFHPLAWLALPRFRLDQELACDERTLRSPGSDARSYARILLSSTGMDAAPALIPWLTEPQLKERLMMIRRHRTNAALRVASTLGLALAGTSLALAAQAMPLARPPAGASQDLAFNARAQPRYPKASIANKEQGTVVLKVLVNPDGTVRAADYDPTASTTTSANLIAAASDAAMNWHFNPALKDGQPIESYARVPVKFSLHASPGTTSKVEAEKKAAEYAKKY